MRYFVLIFFLSGFLSFAGNSDGLWSLFMKSSVEAKAAKELYSITGKFSDENSPAILGYKGIGKLMMCNHLINPASKLSYFNEGKDMLENSIRKDSSLIDIRFFRFSTQCKAPSFLNYRSQIESDKLFLINQLKKTKVSTGSKEEDIIRFMIGSGKLKSEEKKQLELLIK